MAASARSFWMVEITPDRPALCGMWCVVCSRGRGCPASWAWCDSSSVLSEVGDACFGASEAGAAISCKGMAAVLVS